METCATRFFRVVFACAALLSIHDARSQAYPAKPVRLIVSGPPAGGADVLVRPIAQKLSESFGQQFVVENRPGAGSLIAGQAVAGAAPDGYTLLQASASGFSSESRRHPRPEAFA